MEVSESLAHLAYILQANASPLILPGDNMSAFQRGKGGWGKQAEGSEGVLPQKLLRYIPTLIQRTQRHVGAFKMALDAMGVSGIHPFAFGTQLSGRILASISDCRWVDYHPTHM